VWDEDLVPTTTEKSVQVIKEKKFVTITHAHFCNTKLFVMRENASQPNFITDFPSVSAIQGKFVMLRKFVMQTLQISDCDKLFSLHTGYPRKKVLQFTHL